MAITRLSNHRMIIRHRFYLSYAYQRFSLSQGCGRQRGNTDAAVIILAVLIIMPGTSAAIAPLLSTRRNPRWFAVSGFVRVIPPCVLLFLFGGHFSFRRNETTTPKRIVQIFSTLRLRLTVSGLKMTDTLVGLLY